MTAPDAPRPTPEQAREVVALADEVAALLSGLAGAPARFREHVRTAFGSSQEDKVLGELSAIGVERLREVSGERLRVGRLVDGGITTVGAVLRAGPAGLERLPGIGPQTATHCLAAAAQIAQAIQETLRFRIDDAPGDPFTTGLVQALAALDAARTGATRHRQVIVTFLEGHTEHRAAAQEATRAVRSFFSLPARRRRAADAVRDLARLTRDAEQSGAVAAAGRVGALQAEPVDAFEAWTDFRARSATYYALLDDVVDIGRDLEATEGHLPPELLARVNEQPLDQSLLTASLRGYQVFGARYALAQRRTILGDEMGLGKTVQAIAAMAHLAAGGATHFLVVCPASVMTSWVREVGRHSTLRSLDVHGPERAEEAAQWAREGGVAVTTFEQVGLLPLDLPTPAMLVVDEAHYVKNPEAKRSQAVAAWAGRTEHVLFLTGTVMENRVEEFRRLVAYLQPDVAEQVSAAHGAAGAERFRLAVAPVYLRRNQEDVLEELPELVQVEEWETFGPADGAAYRAAVREGSFMAMRRAAYAVDHPEDSAKVRRLVELVEEATGNGRKVVVFTYFRDVVDLVVRALGDLAAGPLTGSVGASARQTILDDFTASPAPRALVSQIDVGGVGVNLQAASVVILCEPQVKPTTEAQAVARAHRMGQVRTVQVHRLLVADTVDERMVEILGTKARLFDAYARRSVLADALPGAVDVSEARLAQTIVAAEQARWLGGEPVVAAAAGATVARGLVDGVVLDHDVQDAPADAPWGEGSNDV